MKRKEYTKIGFLAGDIVIIVIVLLLSVTIALIGMLRRNVQNNSYSVAVVYIGGEIYQEITLDKDGETGINRDGIQMTLRTDAGGIMVARSDCKNQNCVKSGYIYSQNQIVACIPNSVYILIEGRGESDSKFDAVIG